MKSQVPDLPWPDINKHDSWPHENQWARLKTKWLSHYKILQEETCSSLLKQDRFFLCLRNESSNSRELHQSVKVSTEESCIHQFIVHDIHKFGSVQRWFFMNRKYTSFRLQEVWKPWTQFFLRSLIENHLAWANTPTNLGVTPAYHYVLPFKGAEELLALWLD